MAISRGHGGPASSLELYRGLPKRVQELVDAAGFGPFILTLSATKSNHAVLTALAERWQDTSKNLPLSNRGDDRDPAVLRSYYRFEGVKRAVPV